VIPEDATVFAEDDLLPISALQHLLFCERQCALIHIERLWAENRLTVEGRHLHDRVHDGQPETRAGVRVARAVPLRSSRLGLFGVADVVEFHARDDAGHMRDPPLPFPVEYKRGRPKRNDCDRVQLCAQALCLEEMLGTSVPRGALFYGRTRHRETVVLDGGLRHLTEQAAARLHELIASGRTPAAIRESKCKRCSLAHLCLPQATETHRSALRYVRRSIAALHADAATGAESPTDGVPEHRFSGEGTSS
jgi:CRISPR-associated exonuclease Cas4